LSASPNETNEFTVDETAKRISTMKDITLETEEALLACDVSDEALEIASGGASVHANFTLGACTGLSECPG